MEYDKVKDSGIHHDFETGSRRDTQTGKGRPDLISVFMEDRLAKHYENGAIKYAERNWELGQPSSQYIASAKRHIRAYIQGDRSEDHLAAVIWNITGIIHNEELVERGIYPQEILDLPDYTDKDSFDRTIRTPVLQENQKKKDEHIKDVMNQIENNMARKQILA